MVEHHAAVIQPIRLRPKLPKTKLVAQWFFAYFNLISCNSLPDTNIWMLFFDDVAPHTLRRLAEQAGVRADV